MTGHEIEVLLKVLKAQREKLNKEIASLEQELQEKVSP